MYSSDLKPVMESTSLIVKASAPPVIVIGLPRSGSSYLSHVLSCMDDWFIFDDLYPYQKAAALGLSRSTNLAEKPDLLAEYVSRLTWQLRAKVKFEENFQIPNLSLEDIGAMEQALLQALRKSPLLTWPQVLEEWTTRLAIHSGKRCWGYKTPQDFMHMDELTDIFPGVRFIYILRDPRKVMQSFKNLPRLKTHGNQDGESRQYHPVVYALYWRIAYDKIQAFSDQSRAAVEVVKFEDLVKTPEVVADRLARFLETQVTGQVRAQSVNSSYRNRAACELTNIEIIICEKIAGSQMQLAGYDLFDLSPRLLDIVDFAKTSADFAAYQFCRITTNKQARTSVTAFMKNLSL